MTRFRHSWGLSSAGIKLIAFSIMLIDHIGAILLPDVSALRIIGRFGFPLFAFMTAEGVRHTHDIRKYAIRLLLLAVISEMPYDLARTGTIFSSREQNVGWTLFASSIAAWLVLKIGKEDIVKGITAAITAAVLLGFILGCLVNSDWGFFGPAFIIAYTFPGDIAGAAAGTGLSFALYKFPMNISAGAGAITPLFCNGTRGYDAKWFRIASYAFYPAHFLILALIAYII